MSAYKVSQMNGRAFLGAENPRTNVQMVLDIKPWGIAWPFL